MDSQNDSFSYNKQSKRATHNESQLIQPRAAQEEHMKQKNLIAEAEIGELKSSLRYVEIQLAKSKDDNDMKGSKIQETHMELEKCQENLTKQIRYSQQQQRTIDELTKKIDSFNDNQKDLVEKSRFKAGNYMNEINSRDEELAKMRQQVMNSSDELKILTVSREQFRKQNEVMGEKVKARDIELEKLKKKVQDQQNMIDHICMAQKNQSSGIQQLNTSDIEKQKEDIERADRIGRQTNKSSFMSLGDRQPNLVSEEGVGSSKQNQLQSPWKASSEDMYLNDESIPSEIFNMVHNYKEKLVNSRGGQSAVMIIDDFFGEVHKVLKDQHMREIARIRNEQSVEIMRLRKNLESQLKSPATGCKQQSNKSKENFNAYQGSEKFIENEIERQRRALLEENELLKKRLRAVETIIQSSSNERFKFMEGASWIAKKAHIETEKHISKMQGILGELQRKSKQTVIDESIAEMNGREVLKLYQWINQSVDKEMSQMGDSFEAMFENVNYHLKEATKEYGKHSSS